MASDECHASGIVSHPPSSTDSTGAVPPVGGGGGGGGAATVDARNNPMLLSAIEMLPGSIREYFLLTLTTTTFVRRSVSGINMILRRSNVPEKSLLTNEEFVLSSTAVIVTLVGYYLLFGKRHRRKRKRLAEELRLAQRQVSLVAHVCSIVLCFFVVVVVSE
jgi:hypothetical protein